MSPRSLIRTSWLLPLCVMLTACPTDQNPPGPSSTTSATTVPGPSGSSTRVASGGASAASVSRSGRYVAFVSNSDIPGTDANGTGADVFLNDRQTGTTVRLTSGNGPSDSPSVADDGSVVFRSAASDLAGPDSNGVVDAFRRGPDGTIQQITDSGTDVTSVLVSADGTTVVLGGPTSLGGLEATTRIETFRWQPSQPAVMTRVTTSGTAGSTPVSISADGSLVLLAEPGRLSLSFDPAAAPQTVANAPSSPTPPATTTFSVAPHALANDGDVVWAEVTYRFDDESGQLAFDQGVLRRWDRASAVATTLPISGVPTGPSQSADGGRVVFVDQTGALLDQDANQLFVAGSVRSYDMATHALSVITTGSRSLAGTVSANGRLVALVSTATDLVAPDPNGTGSDVYVWDRGS